MHIIYRYTTVHAYNYTCVFCLYSLLTFSSHCEDAGTDFGLELMLRLKLLRYNYDRDNIT